MKNQKIKILFILEATLGGIRKHLLDLAYSLDMDKYELFLIYSLERADDTFKDELPNLEKKIKLFHLKMNRNISFKDDFKSLLSIIKLVNAIKPDLIHMHGAKAGALGRISVLFNKNIRTIYTPHGGALHKIGKGKGQLFRIIEYLLAKRTDYIIGVSEDQCQKISAIFKIEKDKIVKIYNGISIPVASDLFAPNNNEEEKGNYFLYPALFFESKGHLEFLNSLEKVKLNSNVKIIFAGDGPLRDQIEKKIDLLGLKTQLIVLGFCKNMKELYSHSKGVILFSKNEAFGYVLLEAMIYGKPIFATNVDSIPEVVIDGYNGWLFSPDEIEKAVIKINKYYDKKEVLNNIGKNGREKLTKEFSLSKMVEDTDALYIKCVKGINLK